MTVNDNAMPTWLAHVDTSQVPRPAPDGPPDGRRLVVWHCLSTKTTFVDMVVRALAAAPRWAAMFAQGRLTGAVLHCLASPPALPPGVHPVRVGPEAIQVFHGDLRLVGCFCKITTPYLFGDFDASLNLDADLALHSGRADHDRRTEQELYVLFETANRFGIVLTSHPATTWTGEPMLAEQKAAYMDRPGMHRLVPLYVCGAIARRHGDPRAEALTDAWVREFMERPTREQPTFAAAVWRSGVAPLAAPMTFLSLGRVRVRYGLEALVTHMGGRVT